jgi:hypothetical protein
MFGGFVFGGGHGWQHHGKQGQEQKDGFCH